MKLCDLIIRRRSIRKFKPEPIPRDILKKLVNAARVAPSAANRQPLEFIVIDDESIKKEVFSCLKWAAYIAPKGNPKAGEEPAAYVVVLANTMISKRDYERDVGAAMENMILAAFEKGIGSCWIVSIDRELMRGIMNVPEEYKIDSVLALGYPIESPIEELMKDSVKYWKDKEGRLHVPKRKIGDIIHFNQF